MTPEQRAAFFAAEAGLLAANEGLRVLRASLDDAEPPAPTYRLTVHPEVVNEGESVAVTLYTTGVAAGTAVPYALSGVGPADLLSMMGGDLVVGADGTATVTIAIAADDLTEGTETLAINVADQWATVYINDTSLTPTPPPKPPEQPRGKYRHEQPLLFQGFGPGVPGIPGRGMYSEGHKFGPTAVYVDALSGWRWTNRGGDWVDIDGKAQGQNPWAVATQPGAMRPGEVAPLLLDVTQLARREGWAAWIIRCPNAQRRLLSTGAARPSVTYDYEDGTSETRVATVVALCNTGTTIPSLRAAEMACPVMLEFHRATKPVRSALLSIQMTGGEWAATGGPARFEVFPLVPPINTDPVTFGLAASYPLDAGIKAHPDVIHAHQYPAGSSLADFVSPFRGNTDNETEFDAGLIAGTGAADLSKLPHIGQGLWVGQTQSFSYARPGDAGFEPLHPDLGAIRVNMKPHQYKGADGVLRDVQHGDVAGYGGTLSSHCFLYMPAERIYRQRRLFSRLYMRLSYPDGRPTPASRRQVWSDRVGGMAKWNDLGGKVGLTPGGHHNTQGGFSGVAGGGFGTQFRHSWTECAEGIGGPGEGGWYVGWHLYDYQGRNPPGHNYANALAHESAWGQRGGLGSVLYADHWYCVETECLLNDVTETSWAADGELRAWIDGRLCFERTGMVFRTTPVAQFPYRHGYSRPISPLGHVYAGMNVFHGGVTPDSVRRNLDFTAVVVAESRIGPMRMDV